MIEFKLEENLHYIYIGKSLLCPNRMGLIWVILENATMGLESLLRGIGEFVTALIFLLKSDIHMQCDLKLAIPFLCLEGDKTA